MMLFTVTNLGMHVLGDSTDDKLFNINHMNNSSALYELISDVSKYKIEQMFFHIHVTFCLYELVHVALDYSDS